VDTYEPAGTDAAVDDVVAEAGGPELSSRDDPVLAGGESGFDGPDASDFRHGTSGR
jgi:hypothetical protein